MTAGSPPPPGEPPDPANVKPGTDRSAAEVGKQTDAAQAGALPPTTADSRSTDTSSGPEPMQDHLLIPSQVFQARLKAHDVLQEHLKQSVTIASATLALTLTFLKDVLGNIGDRIASSWLLPTAWVLLGTSILLGVLGIATLVNSLDSPGEDKGRHFQAGGTAKTWLPAILTFVTFGLGMLALAALGARNYEALLTYQKVAYKVPSATAAIGAARKAMPPGVEVERVPTVELIKGIDNATQQVPIWHVRLEAGALPPAQVTSPPRTAGAQSCRRCCPVVPSTAPAPRIFDYFVNSTDGTLVTTPFRTP